MILFLTRWAVMAVMISVWLAWRTILRLRRLFKAGEDDESGDWQEILNSLRQGKPRWSVAFLALVARNLASWFVWVVAIPPALISCALAVFFSSVPV